jgi:hypothetical protein
LSTLSEKLNLPKTLERYRSRIMRYDDERGSDNPIFVCYIPGWKSYTDPVGIQHSDAELNVSDILACVRSAHPCDCDECVKAINTSPETVLDYLRSASAFTPLELDTFEWAADPTEELAESEDGTDERIAKGESLFEYMRTDMIYRLGEQLPMMAGDTEGRPDKERMEALRSVGAAKRIVERLEKLERKGK